MLLQLLIVLLCIIVGARLGGMGLGVMGGLGVALLTFLFGLQPTSPPVDVMLMIAAVISAAAPQKTRRNQDLHEVCSFPPTGMGFPFSAAAASRSPS